MARPGNEPVTVGVRPHAYVAAALLALAPVAALLPAPRDLPLVLLHAGLTLVVQAVALWYLPSFTKRGVFLPDLAAYAGPILLPAAALGVLLRSTPLWQTSIALALGSFAMILLLTPRFGARWRGGVPFWRASGRHRKGDAAALAAFALSALWLLALALAALFSPFFGGSLLALGWPLALGFFALGALAHLLPRSRGTSLAATPFLVGLAAANAGALLVILRERARLPLPHVVDAILLAGLPLAAFSLMPREGKDAGPRLSQSRPFLLAAALALVLSLFVLVAGYPRTAAVVPGYLLLVVSVVAGVAAVSLLALPVVFNQRPDPRFVAPSAAALAIAAALVAADAFLPIPAWPAALAGGAGAWLWLAALAPLRTPRRECGV